MTSLSALASKDTTMPSPPSELAVVRLSASGLESHAQSNGGTTSTSFETLITIPADGHRGFANEPSGPSRRVRRARERQRVTGVTMSHISSRSDALFFKKVSKVV